MQNLPAQVLCMTKHHLQTITLDKHRIQPLPTKTTPQRVSFKPLYHSHKYRHDNNNILYTNLKIMKRRR